MSDMSAPMSPTAATTTQRRPQGAPPSPVPDVDVRLSRPAYRLGDSIVGTIQIYHKGRIIEQDHSENSTESGEQDGDENAQHSDDSANDIRESLDSAVVYVAGYCRIDARWHNIADYKKLYGITHPQLEDLQSRFSRRILSPSSGQPDSPIVSFWATNAVDLLELNERHGVIKSSENGHSNGHSGRKAENGHGDIRITVDKTCLSFTFRADIPNDLPPSISGNTCRYFYSVEVLIRSKSKQERSYKIPFAVRTSIYTPIPQSNGERASFVSSGRVRIGTCEAMAHSGGLPCHLSATEINQPRGQLSIQSSSLTRPNTHNVQSLRVTNAAGNPVCMFTIVGCSPLSPGGRVHLKWDFLRADWIPCPQVSAAILGEERARYEDGTTKRTRSFVFDTCLERLMDPSCTRQVCHSLLLPLDAPYTMRTDLMEISFTCQVDIVTMESEGKYNNLRLDIPCRVVHSSADFEGDDEGDDDNDGQASSLPLQDIMAGPAGTSEVDSSFPTSDILPDLKALSLHVHRSNERNRTNRTG